MVSENQRSRDELADQTAEELAHLADEPLLPVEKKLIAYSLILGVVLLGVLFWLSSVWFPVPTNQ